MKKVLIIGFLHPFTYDGGSFRPLPLAKHLPAYGWEPIVLSPLLLEKVDLPFRVIETPYRDALGFLKKLLGFNLEKDIKLQVKERFGVMAKKSLLDFIFAHSGAILNYPDHHRGWKSLAFEAGCELLEREKIDAIISCHPVATSHMVASALKTKYQVPWIADFADLWSQNTNYHYGRLRKLRDERLERKTLSNADALVTTSEPWASKLRWLHNPWANKLSKLPEGKRVYAITHGFDPAEVNKPPAGLADKFTVTYTGSIYGEHDPSRLLVALRHLVLEEAIGSDDIEVRFYSAKRAWLDREIEHYGLSGIVKQYGMVPRDVAVEKQRESQLLLRLKLENAQEGGGYSGKIFEYLAARRPILSIGDREDVVSDLLDETKAGVRALTVKGVEYVLRKFYREYKLKGQVAYKGDEAEINKYTHSEMARKFAEVLNSNEQ